MNRITYAATQGVRDVKLVLWRVVLLGFQSALLATLLVFSADQVASTISDVRQASTLADRGLIYHVPLYASSEPLKPSEELRSFLADILGDGAIGYSFQKSPDIAPETFEGGPVVAVYGNFASVFNLGVTDRDAPFALVGSERNDVKVGDTLTWAGNTTSIVGVIPPGSSFLDQWDGKTSLDDSIVLVGDDEMIQKAEVGFEEIALRVVLDPDDRDVRSTYLRLIGESGDFLALPRSFGDKIVNEFRSEFAGDIFFLAVFSAAFAGGVISAAVGALSLLQKRKRDLIATTFVGANRADLAGRISVFVLLAWFVPSSFGLMLASVLAPEPLDKALAASFLFVSCVFAAGLVLFGVSWVFRATSDALQGSEE